MAWSGVITNSGEALLQAMVGGASLTLTSVQTGSGNTADMYAATSLNTPVATGTMSMQVEDNGVRVRMKITPYTTAYTMKEIGIYGRIGSGTPVLFALMQDSTGISIPDNNFPDFIYNMSTFISMSNTDNFSVTVDPDAYVSEDEFEAAVGNIVQLARNFYASTSSVTCSLAANQKSYIVYSSGSASSGITDATYGALVFVSNGKYAVLHKGSAITISVSGSNLVVTSSSSVPMAVLEM